MTCEHSHLRSTTPALLVGSLLMLAGGVMYRAVAAPANRVPLDPNIVAGFPLLIGKWTGQEIPIHPDIEAVIDADAYVSRRYVRQDGHEMINLYLPCGTDAPELLQHIPENCFVGAGWTIVDRRPEELSLSDGSVLRCSIVQLFRGGLDIKKLVVLHLLVVDGDYFTTFSEVVRSKGWRHFAEAGYAGQVQIVTSADNVTVSEAEGWVTAFAVDAAPFISQLFESLKKAPLPE